MSGPNEPVWDLPDPFSIDLEVGPEDIDRYGHTNNAVYLAWCEELTWAHSRAAGLEWSDFQRLDRAMAIRSTELEFLAPSYEGDRLRAANWITRNDGRVRATRRYQICRLSDGATLLRGNIHFFCIELETGRPRRFPPEFRQRFPVLESVAQALASDANKGVRTKPSAAAAARPQELEPR